jgi:hypothetical protein
MILAWGMQSAMAPLHRLLRNRPALRTRREASLEIGNVMRHTNLTITPRTEALHKQGDAAFKPQNASVDHGTTVGTPRKRYKPYRLATVITIMVKQSSQELNR